MPDWFTLNAPMSGPLQKVADWFTQNSPTSLYQTRITHTPGGVVSDLGDAYATYDPRQSALDMVRNSNLSDADKAKLIAQWQNLGPGFIRATPTGVNDPSVMRHEQLHDVQYHSPLNESQIAGMVNPFIIQQLHNTPTYQQEMKGMGVTPVEAKEGMAFNLIPMNTWPRWQSGDFNPGLRAYLLDQLKNDPIRRRQFERLTDLSQLPDYQP